MKSRRTHDFNFKKVRTMHVQQRLSSLVMGAGFLLVLVWVLFFAIAARAASPPVDVKQRLFTGPEEATKALVDAANAKDRASLAALFGPEYGRLLSGDAVQDNHELELFAAALDKSAQLRPAGEDKFTLAIGDDNFPFPIPLVRQGKEWRFDTKAGMEEILNRRIGENELSAIATCRAYVLAQWEYFTDGDHDNDGVAEYAQRFFSTPGQKDGLFWETAEGETPSPMGVLVAAARTEGYSAGRNRQAPAAGEQIRQRTPYHGYFFKILKSQGPHAPGGKYNYIINGNMIAGYALIASPDKWGSSGVMTFIVNQQGRVYQKNLGPNTLKVAGATNEYDPDASWTLVKE